MTKKVYRPMIPETIGRTVSCHTLARMLNEEQSNKLTRKVISNICRHFELVRRISLSIHDPEVRKEVGEIILQQVKHFDIGIDCPERIKFVIRNVKYAYIKDMLISDNPMNYSRKLRVDEIKDYLASFDDYEFS